MKKSKYLLWIVAALAALGPFTIDLYLPAFPQIQQDFSTTAFQVQLTLTGTTLGFAVGQLFVGPWSDKIGRRTPLIFSGAMYVMTCFLAVFAPHIYVLSALRIVQGATAAISTIVARAVVRDLFEGQHLVKMLGKVALISGVAPLIAPVIGSQILFFAPWRGIFIFLTLFGAIVLVAVVLELPETLSEDHQKLALNPLKSYKKLLLNHRFVGVALVGGLVTASIFVYLSTATFVFQGTYGLNAQQFGFLFTAMSIATFCGIQTGSRLVPCFGAVHTLWWAVVCMVIGNLTIIFAEHVSNSLFAVAIPLWLTIFTIGICFMCVQVLSLENHPAEAGAASALVGASDFGLAAIATPVAGIFGVDRIIPMVIMMLILAILAGLCIIFLMKPFERKVVTSG